MSFQSRSRPVPTHNFFLNPDPARLGIPNNPVLYNINYLKTVTKTKKDGHNELCNNHFLSYCGRPCYLKLVQDTRNSFLRYSLKSQRGLRCGVQVVGFPLIIKCYWKLLWSWSASFIAVICRKLNSSKLFFCTFLTPEQRYRVCCIRYAP